MRAANDGYTILPERERLVAAALEPGTTTRRISSSIAKGEAMTAPANFIVAFLVSLALAGCASSGNQAIADATGDTVSS